MRQVQVGNMMPVRAVLLALCAIDGGDGEGESMGKS